MDGEGKKENPRGKELKKPIESKRPKES